ncbi:MAG: hypothetical protein HQL28_05365 [Candidatus Omnitrophica bacterium]|nr:hypothetical protein [Candidatus Omnitrophota bacterium]
MIKHNGARFFGGLAALVIFLCFNVAGCGYTSSSLLPSNIKTIFVDNFENKIDVMREISDTRNSYSYRPGLEIDITRATINAFIRDRHITIDKRDNSDILLKGQLVDYKQYPLSYDKQYDIEEFRMEVFVDITMYDRKTGEVMWSEKRFMGRTEYTTTGEHSKTESEAAADAVKDLAQRIVERTVEHW